MFLRIIMMADEQQHCFSLGLDRYCLFCSGLKEFHWGHYLPSIFNHFSWNKIFFGHITITYFGHLTIHCPIHLLEMHRPQELTCQAQRTDQTDSQGEM